MRIRYGNILNSQNSGKLSACANSGYQATLSGGGGGRGVWPGYEARGGEQKHIGRYLGGGGGACVL